MQRGSLRIRGGDLDGGLCRRHLRTGGMGSVAADETRDRPMIKVPQDSFTEWLGPSQSAVLRYS
jgi:hypothetical protein